MGLLLTTTFGLILWICLWAGGIKGFDGFMIVVLLILLAVIGRAALQLLPGNRED